MLYALDDPAGSLISNIILITPCHGYIAGTWSYRGLSITEKTGAVILLISPPVKTSYGFFAGFSTPKTVSRLLSIFRETVVAFWFA